jgi:hypothetical protein
LSNKQIVDKRQHNRYRLAASVSFSWETDDHRVHHGYGQTRDCSISGAFIVSPNKLPIGSILQMEFSLPRLLAAGSGARLKIRGCVVRTEPEGFAVLAEMSPSSLLHGGQAMPAGAMHITERVKPVR